jgi:hypothetical protein
MLELGVGKAGVDYKRGLALGQARAKRESMFHINNLPAVRLLLQLSLHDNFHMNLCILRI